MEEKSTNFKFCGTHFCFVITIRHYWDQKPYLLSFSDKVDGVFKPPPLGTNASRLVRWENKFEPFRIQPLFKVKL